MHTTIAAAAQKIRAGELVAFPTETVYGLGANALDAMAVAQIFEIKGRPHFDPLIVHVAEAEQLSRLTTSVPPVARTLIERFWPGPLSLVLPKSSEVPDIVTAGLPSVALRCPGHEVARSLIAEAGLPIAAPSANRFGEVSPTTAAHVREQFGDQLSLVLDAGPCAIGLESTVVSCLDDKATLLRPGGTPLEEIEATIGPVQLPPNQPARPTSPGQLTRHYATRTRLVVAEDGVEMALSRLERTADLRVGLLSWDSPQEDFHCTVTEVLSPAGDLREAGVHLFAAMRRLDQADLDVILAAPVPEVGLGRAIMDRLRRAAAR